MPEAKSLRAADYFVVDVPLSLAQELVEEYHYSKGGSRTRVYTHGLYRRDAPELCLGVAWWLPPTRPAAVSVSPDEPNRVLSLTRLVILPQVPTNGASFLLGASMKLIRKDGRYKHLVTYADEGQGHLGNIYRATNWEYVGAMPGQPAYRDGSGRQVSRKMGAVTRNNTEMLELGYVNTGRTRKHKFVMHL